MDKREKLVSVLVLTYHADREKLKKTLQSIVEQEDADSEIIIADDGSGQTWDADIEVWMESWGYTDYTIANSPENVGTCKNLYHALEQAGGKYVKAISPGDYLYEKQCLKKWCDYMEKTGCVLSFGDGVYYSETDREGNPIPLPMVSAPINKDIFHENQKRRDVFVSYLLANDTILGATILMTREAMEEYLSQILGQVIYAEDYMVRLMVLLGERILYYPKKTIWYEYGTGISTAKANAWAKKLQEDLEGTNRIMLGYKELPDKEARQYVSYIKNRGQGVTGKIKKFLSFPDMLYWRIRMKKRR